MADPRESTGQEPVSAGAKEGRERERGGAAADNRCAEARPG
eukprot:CAMPEP_0204600466 /NCGR_PEP_ID=MMETSP0661-20131031/55461_1 /ASSEMBLY_ACC=CAM_ASM_000606 /TAXON_ID=109239 /ORGANISM="Alexandrium margalefi, Strain AMGDE01CS-322" /LENGTH=40 /DNA_ID= /DNA_START= /DNA_END= /DNA_ORIENTATION=